MIIGKPLLSTEEIQKRVRQLAEEITEDYQDRELLAVGILRGAFMFFADLVRHIRVPLKVDFIVASSYVKTETTGEVKIHCDLREDVRGKDVLLVEDIVDTGLTLSLIRKKILEKGPSSLKVCAFLDKRERRVVDVPIDYRGFVIPNEFVVGYGLDYEDQYRNLPYISIFKKSI